jgi:membrane-bound lytic murein transglycosylase F
VRLRSVSRFADILPMVANREADFAAAGITVTPLRETQVRFTPHYQVIQQQVVHHGRTRAPADAKELVGRHIEVVAGTSYIERLEELKTRYPELAWTTVSDLETEELLLQVEEGLTDITIADSNIVALTRQLNPDLNVAFELSNDERLAWAFPRDDDNSLFEEATRFIEQLRSSGELAHLIERHYGAATRFNPINIAAFLQKIESDLPRFRLLFEEAGRRYAVDWRLLAALSYQESYWSPAAVSPTGVRGIMMLTATTAEHLGVRDRLDPRQSVTGGAAYLRNLIDRLPERIPDPDRTWMALAAYNVGFNHLEDARIITQRQGADPDKWSDVKERLPLLAKAVWHTKTRHGYARGYEPVQFVTRIRTYYDVLRKNDGNNRMRDDTDVLRLRAPAL